MDYSSFLGEKRWEILKIIAGRPSSPIEISEKLGTTVSYVSQQLKFLEVAGLISKRKTGLSEKGKPRNIYFVKKEFAQITLLEEDLAVKKTVDLNTHKKAILKIWSLDDESYHTPLEKIFFELEKDLGKVEGIFVSQESRVELLVVSGSKEVRNRIDRLLKSLGKRVIVKYLDIADLSKVSFDLFLKIYSSENLSKKIREEAYKR